MRTSEKLSLLRDLMQKAEIQAAYIGCSDPHQSESVAQHWKAVQWLTGFTGSMGYAIVTPEEAAFWTDGRYTTQAHREIEEGTFTIHTIGTPGVPLWNQWLAARLQEGASLAVDGEVLSEAMKRDLEGRLPVRGLKILHDCNFLGEIWKDRPQIPAGPVWELEALFCGEGRREKLERLRKEISREGANAFALVNCLDDVAWLTNLRGPDNPLYPFFHAYALVGMNEASLCADLNKFPSEIKGRLQEDGWSLHPYEEMARLVSQLPPGSAVIADPYKTPNSIFAAIPSYCEIKEKPDICTALKAKKSPVEQANIREANRKEAAAVIRLMMWLEKEVPSGRLDEYGVGKKLEEFRKMDLLHLHPANIPIVGFGKNAALPHYRPSKENSAAIKPAGFLLFDVCAQYLCGSTDLTRTVAIGPLTSEMKRDYTLTLKSHIALARQKFPYGTTGNLLDAIVKSHHWNRCMTFGHGTGHGIGYVLNIHEGPAKIITEFAPAFPYALNTPLEEGMLFSNEPGVYKPGRHGIRIENSVLVRRAEANEFGTFLEFETVTFIPYERRAIVKEDLSEEEIKWINSYHEECLRRISPLLDDKEKEWLKEKTRPL